MPPILVFERAAKRPGKIGSLVLEVTLQENHERKNRVTQWPIEDGSSISDHIANEPKRLTMDGLITDSPLGSLERLEPARTLDAYRLLMQMWRDRDVLEVVTQLETYYNMAIEQITVPKSVTNGQGLRFNVALVQIRKVTSQSVIIPADTFPPREAQPEAVEEDPPGSIPDQATPETDTGSQPTVPPEEDTSYLYDIIFGGAESQPTPQELPAVEIPVNPQLSAQTFETSLSGEPYRVELAWNTREQAWGMGLSTREGEPIVQGIKMVPNYELVDRLADERLPKGYMMALDTTRRKDTIGRFDLGDTVPLVFVPREPIA